MSNSADYRVLQTLNTKPNELMGNNEQSLASSADQLPCHQTQYATQNTPPNLHSQPELLPTFLPNTLSKSARNDATHKKQQPLSHHAAQMDHTKDEQCCGTADCQCPSGYCQGVSLLVAIKINVAHYYASLSMTPLKLLILAQHTENLYRPPIS